MSKMISVGDLHPINAALLRNDGTYVMKRIVLMSDIDAAEPRRRVTFCTECPRHSDCKILTMFLSAGLQSDKCFCCLPTLSQEASL